VQYIGWFQSRERDEGGVSSEYFNLVLEFGDDDLYTIINTFSPPISANEHIGLWERMLDISCALRSIHSLEIEGVPYHG
jgi:hypothetical protein